MIRQSLLALALTIAAGSAGAAIGAMAAFVVLLAIGVGF